MAEFCLPALQLAGLSVSAGGCWTPLGSGHPANGARTRKSRAQVIRVVADTHTVPVAQRVAASGAGEERPLRVTMAVERCAMRHIDDPWRLKNSDDLTIEVR